VKASELSLSKTINSKYTAYIEPTSGEAKIKVRITPHGKWEASEGSLRGYCKVHITEDTEKERETDKVADRQARLFLLNLMLVDLPTMRNFTYETLFFGNHERESRQ
jgi:hypothetical protein